MFRVSNAIETGNGDDHGGCRTEISSVRRVDGFRGWEFGFGCVGSGAWGFIDGREGC